MDEEALFDLVLNTPEAERAALLDRHCVENPELRQRVEALLAAHGSPKEVFQTPASSIENPTIEAPSSHASKPESGQSPLMFDLKGVVLAEKYKLVQEIGEGGMGSVWLAQQYVPMKRKVAIKLVKAGMDTKQVLARFEAERQALALMDHPNIAKVFDGGITPDNRPFFVMELVKGVPITQYADDNQLTPHERLQLFIPVCHAIQHAHQKGIIHRDIKPSNVLVAMYDNQPVVKVIDFGVAKATGGTLTEYTLDTGFGNVVGTPQYMSPEQATFNNLDIDTRSDIYSLGVLLYELLTGSPPLSKGELKKRGLLEILRVIREEEPSKPSTKLSTSEALASVSANRKTEPKRLMALLRNELDWLVLKALDKDRSRRYETANGFAADILRYLAGEPITAHPPSRFYRLKKAMRRNKTSVLTGLAMVFCLLIGVVGLAWGLYRAEERRVQAVQALDEKAIALEAESKALEAEKQAKELADQKRQEAEQAQKITAEQRKLALDTIRTVLNDIDSRMRNDVTLASTRTQIVTAMLRDLDKIRDHANKNPLAETTDMSAANRMGDIFFRAGRVEDAVVWLGKCHKIAKQRYEQEPTKQNVVRDYAAACKELAAAQRRVGNETEAITLYRDTIETYQQMGKLLEGTNAEDNLFSTNFSDQAYAFYNLGIILAESGNAGESLKEFQQAEQAFSKIRPPQNLAPQNRFLLNNIRSHKADALARTGELFEAEKILRELLKEREEAVRVTFREKDLLMVKNDLRFSQILLGDFLAFYRQNIPEAYKLYEAALKLQIEVYLVDPKQLVEIRGLATALYRVGVTSPDPQRAKQALSECYQIRKQLNQLNLKDAIEDVGYLLICARLGIVDTVTGEGERLLWLRKGNRQVLFQVACAYSILAGTTSGPKKQQEFQQRCLTVLFDAVLAGWKDPQAMLGDIDFEFVRDNPLFKLIVESIQNPDKRAEVKRLLVDPASFPELKPQELTMFETRSKTPTDWVKLVPFTSQSRGFLPDENIIHRDRTLVTITRIEKGKFDREAYTKTLLSQMQPLAGKPMVEVTSKKIKVGNNDAETIELTGTALQTEIVSGKPTDYGTRQHVSVVCPLATGDTLLITLQGPLTNVTDSRGGFDKWLASFEWIEKNEKDQKQK